MTPRGSSLATTDPSAKKQRRKGSEEKPRRKERPRAILPPLHAGFARALLAWYDQHARALPWREDRDPYRVWLSEIMLQQTRVRAVLEHYRNFLKKFPTVQKLAQAREASVLAAWSGLGYYRRARMLHTAAKVIVKEHGSMFPRTAAGLCELPGIGRYTAAAIASIAFDQPVAVVDGNVERVIARLRGKSVPGEELWQAAQALLEHEAESLARPGDFNQAIMELGATVCVPGPPKCLLCPVTGWCATRGELAAGPAKTKQKKRPITYALARRDGRILLVQRGHEESLMAGMWELPEWSPTGDQVNGETVMKDTHPTVLQLRHSITVTDYAVRVVAIEGKDIADGFHPKPNSGKWFQERRLPALALTGLARKILRQTGLI